MVRFAAVFALLAALPASAGTYYVSPQGSQVGDGTREKPFAASDVLMAVKPQPGDEIVFLDGVYDMSKAGLTISSTGTEKAPVVYRAQNRHGAVLDGGAPVTGWRRGEDGVWECRVARAPWGLLVNGEGVVAARGQGQAALEEGTFSTEAIKEGGAILRMRTWADQEPKEVFGVGGTLIAVGGAYNIVDGFVVRRGATGIHVAGRPVHTHRLEAGLYRDLCGLANNLFGSFNIVRNCIVRDMVGQGMTSNESRFNLIEDNVIYNAGLSQGSHGIYISQGAENLTLRRNVWWRTSGGAIHIYSGSGIDSPRNTVVEYNIFGPDKRNRCFPVKNRKSCALYVWGGSRWAGYNRIVHNIVIGPHDRAISMHKCNFNLIANNTFLNSDGTTIQIGSGFGNIVVNNIIEYGPGANEAGAMPIPDGYVSFLERVEGAALSRLRNNVLLPRDGKGADVPEWMEQSIVVQADPFVNRAAFDFRLKPDCPAVDAGIAIHYVTGEHAGRAPDAGALELGDAIYGEQGRFPEIPKWLLEEWPLSKRGQ